MFKNVLSETSHVNPCPHSPSTVTLMRNHLCGFLHDRSFIAGTPPSKEVPAGQYPFIVTSDDGRQVPVVQAYAFGKYLGYLKVEFDEKGNVVTSHGNPILLNSSILEGT